MVGDNKNQDEIYEGDDIDDIADKLFHDKPKKESPHIDSSSPLCYAIIGLGKILAIISIAFTTITVFTTTDGLLAKILTVPQICLGVAMLLYYFVVKPIKNKENK